MAITGIHHIALHTSNLDRMVRFYQEAFGFESSGPEYSWKDNPVIDKMIDIPGSAARTVMLRAGNVYIELFEFSAPEARDADPLRPNDRGYTHLAILSDDAETDYERLLKAGMTFAHPVGAIGGVRAVYGKDPDGNIIELQQVMERDHPLALDKLPLFGSPA